MGKLLLRLYLSVCLLGLTCGMWAQGQTQRGKPALQGQGEERSLPTGSEPSVAPLGMTGRGDGSGQPAFQTVTGQVPRVIKFSGVLRDQAGQAKTGVAGVTFAIYAEEEGGTPLWIETQNVVLEKRGRYTVLLGANSNGGVPMELFNGSGEWRVASGEQEPARMSALQNGIQSGERWLGVEGQDIQQSPRVLLVSVPYALKAADAETLGGLPASAFLLANSQAGTNTQGSGTGPATPAGKGAGTVTAAGLKPGPYQGGTKGKATSAATAPDNDDFVSKFVSGNLVPSAIYEANGSVGIGTTSPAAALHVNGDTLLVNSGTTAQVRVNGQLSSGRFGQDANGTFLANDTSGSPLRFLTSNSSNLNEWMRIGSTGSVNIGSAQAAQFGEAVFARDDLDSVHSYIAQAGSQYHFRLSRATPDIAGFKDFLIAPYKFGMAIEYPGTVEVWTGSFSVHNNPRCPWCGPGPNFWVDDEVDSGGLFSTAMSNRGGTSSTVTLAADRFDHTSHGSLNFIVRNTTDAFRFDVGPFGAEVMKGQISGTATGSSLDLFSGAVQATVRAQSAGSSSGGSAGAGGVQLGSTSNDAVSLFTNNGTAQVTLFPSGNFSVGNSTDAAQLAVGTAAQFQVSSTGAATIGGGTPITRHISLSAPMAIPVLKHGACHTISVAVAGAVDGDSVALGIPNALAFFQGISWLGWVSAPDTVSVRACNAADAPTVEVPAGNIRVDVWQH